MATIPASSRRNGRGIWLYKRSFRHRILRFTLTEATTESCSYLAWQSTLYSFRISGNQRRWLLLRGLTAARVLLWWRPLQTQLFNHFWEDTEKFGIHPGFGGAGRGQTWGGGVSHWARQLLSIWSYQWHAVIGQLIVTSPERDQIAHACRGTLVRLGKRDGRHLSVWRKQGTRDLSRHELALNRALRISAPLFFPHRSLWGRKREGARGGIALWKKVMRVRREARLMLSQWEQSEPASAASAWYFPRQETHSLWPSSACRGDLHEPQ